MTQYRTERRLTWLYSAISVFTLVMIASFAIVWNHWKETLNKCPETRLENLSCGCILYGVTRHVDFAGGHSSICHYIIYAPLLVFVYAVIMACYHMYRVCINSQGKYEQERGTMVEQKEGEVIIMTSRSEVVRDNDPVVYCWIPNAVVGSVLGLYSLIHASILNDGYNKTCTQYRDTLIKIMRVTGIEVTAIHSRLSCQAIFDYMDYLAPDTNQSRRGNYINTGAALTLAIVCAWSAVLCWLLVVVYTSIRAYKEREVMTCCGK